MDFDVVPVRAAAQRTARLTQRLSQQELYIFADTQTPLAGERTFQRDDSGPI